MRRGVRQDREPLPRPADTRERRRDQHAEHDPAGADVVLREPPRRQPEHRYDRHACRPQPRPDVQPEHLRQQPPEMERGDDPLPLRHRQQPVPVRRHLDLLHPQNTGFASAGSGAFACPHAASVTTTSGEMSTDEERRFHFQPPSPTSDARAPASAPFTSG